MVDEKASLNEGNFFEKNSTNAGDDKNEGNYMDSSQEYIVTQTNDTSKAKLSDQQDEAIVGNTTSQTIDLEKDIFSDSMKNQIQTDDLFTNGEASGMRQENKSFGGNQTNSSIDGAEEKNILNSLTDEESKAENHGDIQESIKSQEILNSSILTNMSNFNTKNDEVLKSSDDATQDSIVIIPDSPTDIVSGSNMSLANENLDQLTNGDSPVKNFEILANKTSTFKHEVTPIIETDNNDGTNNPHQKIYQNQDQGQH